MSDVAASKPTEGGNPPSRLPGVETLFQIPNVTLSTTATAIRIPSPNDDSSIELSYNDLSQLIQSTSTLIRTQTKLNVGQVVTIAMKNTLPFVLSFLGVTWTSAVSAPLNPNYTSSEYKFYMEDNESVLLLVPDGEGNEAAEEAAKELGISVYSVGWSSTNKLNVEVTHKSGPTTVIKTDDSSTDDEATTMSLIEPNPTNVALFLHTSGTTAKPKGVPLTHANLIRSMNNIANTYELAPQDTVLLVMPLFHVHGLMSALLTTLATGGTVILPPEGKFSASHFWHYANTGSATWVTAVPTMYQVLLLRYETDFPKTNPPKFRFVRSCSSSLAPVILTEIESKFNAPCLEAYAMTEASHQMCSNPLPKYGQRKAGTVGKGTGVDVAILDPTTNCVIEERNVVGEVCIRGDNVMKGYRGVTDEVNVEAFAGGWFHTGDQGKLDEDRYLTLTGRIKELINRGGEKISPLEVDAAMLTHPAVAEAVSFAMPHETYGEVVAAAIVLKQEAKDKGTTTLDVKEMNEFLSDKLSPFKIPTKLFVADELPKTATGKIQRRIVAAHFL